MDPSGRKRTTPRDYDCSVGRLEGPQAAGFAVNLPGVSSVRLSPRLYASSPASRAQRPYEGYTHESHWAVIPSVYFHSLLPREVDIGESHKPKPKPKHESHWAVIPSVYFHSLLWGGYRKVSYKLN